MMSKHPDEKIEIDDEQSVHVYSNLISFNVNPEEVCIGMGIRDIKEPFKIHVHTYLHLTIPHFLRFAETVQKQLELLIDKGVVSHEPTQ